MAEETPPGEKPEGTQLNLQPIIDALAPKAPEIVATILNNAKDSASHALSVEKWVVWLAIGVIATVAAGVVMAAVQGNFDTVERLAIPLISFAGGFGIGSRISRQTARAG